MQSRETILKTICLTAVLYFVSLLFSWPPARLFGHSIQAYARHSDLTSRLENGLDSLFISDFLPNSGDAMAALPSVMVPVALGYFLFHVFLNAGVMRCFAKEDERPISAFGTGVFRQGPRFVILSLVFLPLYGGLLLLFWVACGEILDRTPVSASEMMPAWLIALAVFLFGLAFLVVHILHGVARAAMALNDWGILMALRSMVTNGPRLVLGMLARYAAVLFAGGAVSLGAACLGVMAYGIPLVMTSMLNASLLVHIGARVWLQHLLVDQYRRRGIYPP